ncbi:MAG: hypothetical protein AAF412_10435 [Pseudomonadota bacterium]
MRQREIALEVELDELLVTGASDTPSLRTLGTIFPFEGGQVEVRAVDEGLGFDQTALVTLAVSFSAGVASGVVANAIYAICTDAVRRLTFEGRRVQLSEEALNQAIQTIIDYGHRNEDNSK